MKTRFQLFLLFMLVALGAQARVTDVDIAGDIQLKGLLGNKLKIEMVLSCNHSTPFFANVDKTCLDIEGDYYYRTQLMPIHLRGRVCPANATFFLAAQEGSEETERFEGKWDVRAKKLSGTWTLKSTGKTMPFAVTATEVGLQESTMKGYYAVLQELLATEPDAEGAKIESASWNAQKGGQITDFAANWGGELDICAPTRLQYWTSYTSTARSTYYLNTFQLLPSTKGIYVAHFYTYSNYEKTYADDMEEMDGNEMCAYDVRVFQFKDESAEEVTEQVFPTGFVTEKSFEENGAGQCYGQLTFDGLLMPSGEKLYWNGEQYLK
jgi:hypothetical protein